MGDIQQLERLSRMIDDAVQLAQKSNEALAVYVLSIASLQISERIEAERAATDDARPE